MLEFVLFCIPSVLYVVICVRGRGRTVSEALERVGASAGVWKDYGRAALVAVPVCGAAALVLLMIPVDVASAPGVTVAMVTSVYGVIAAVLKATGEEIFFRGLLGGVFVRRLGFAWGNTLQAVVFLLPHTVLLTIDASLWPVLPIQFAAGWLLGWLRHTSGSFVPAAVVHAGTNLAAGLLLS